MSINCFSWHGHGRVWPSPMAGLARDLAVNAKPNSIWHRPWFKKALHPHKSQPQQWSKSPKRETILHNLRNHLQETSRFILYYNCLNTGSIIRKACGISKSWLVRCDKKHVKWPKLLILYISARVDLFAWSSDKSIIMSSNSGWVSSVEEMQSLEVLKLSWYHIVQVIRYQLWDTTKKGMKGFVHVAIYISQRPHIIRFTI